MEIYSALSILSAELTQIEEGGSKILRNAGQLYTNVKDFTRHKSNTVRAANLFNLATTSKGLSVLLANLQAFGCGTLPHYLLRLLSCQEAVRHVALI
jgi:hypothetical protein